MLLSDLVTKARQRTDTVSSGFVTDSEIQGYLNDSLAELDDALVGTYEDYKVTVASATIASSTDGTNYFATPADFLKLRGVDRQASSGFMTVGRFDMQERNTWSSPYADRAAGWPACWYRLEGTKVWIIPWPNAAGSYRIWYVPRFAVLASGDTIPDHMATQAWTEYAIADVGVKIQQKQDLDPSVFAAQKQALSQRIIASAATRDAAVVRVAVNTRDRRSHDRRGWGR